MVSRSERVGDIQSPSSSVTKQNNFPPTSTLLFCFIRHPKQLLLPQNSSPYYLVQGLYIIGQFFVRQKAPPLLC